MPAFASIYLAHPGSRAIHQRPGAGSTAVVIQRAGLLCRRLASASPGMVLVQSGRKILLSRGREVVVLAGEAVLIPDRLDFDVLNEPDGSEPYRALALGFAPELIESLPLATTGAVTRIQPLCVLPPGLPEACGRAAEAIAAGDGLPDRVAAGRVSEVLFWLASLGHRFEAPAGTDPIDRLRKIIMADPGRDWRAFELAERIGASEPTLRRRLATAGTNFTEILVDIRMTAALYQLQSTDKPVTAIALDVGYDSASRFAARFKARFDFSPVKFRAIAATLIETAQNLIGLALRASPSDDMLPATAEPPAAPHHRRQT